MIYTDNFDFDNYITSMQNKWLSAKALETNISDQNFKNIVINSLLSSWNSAIATLYNINMTSSEAIFRLQIWNTRVKRNYSTYIEQSTIVLQTETPRQ